MLAAVAPWRSRPTKGWLADEHPELLAELHLSRNRDLDPASLSVGSSRKLWWHCAICGHDWEAQVKNRTQGTGCPACAGRLTPPERSLPALRPDLLLEWHETRNSGLDPSALSVRSGKRVRWRCAHCSHGWQAEVASRHKGTGCPSCFRSRVRRPPLAIGHPDIAAELHPTRNGDLNTTELRQWSWEQIWWQCQRCGHEWQASPAGVK